MTKNEVAKARKGLLEIVAAIESGELVATDVQRSFITGALTALSTL